MTKFRLHRRDHYEVVCDLYDDVPMVSLYFPHLDMARCFTEWYFEHGGEESFLKYRGPVIESVEQLEQATEEDDYRR